MSDPYVGEMRMFAGNYAPPQWALCNGQMLSINGNEMLFSLIGASFGGDARTTFALPDFRGRLPIHQGTGTGLTPRVMAQSFGSETVTLLTDQMPSHNHTFQATSNIVGQSVPTNNVVGAHNDSDTPYLASPDPTKYQVMNTNVMTTIGASQAHSNMMPFLTLSFIICLVGLYPTRN